MIQDKGKVISEGAFTTCMGSPNPIVFSLSEETVLRIVEVVYSPKIRTISHRNKETLDHRKMLFEKILLDNKVNRLSEKRQEADRLIEESKNKESFGESVKKFLKSFFDPITDDKDLQDMRKSLRKRLEEEDECLEDLSYEDLVVALRDIIYEREHKYYKLISNVDKSLTRIKRFIDLRLRIRRFIDKMYQYHNGDDEEFNSYKTYNNFSNSFIMNSLNPLHHAIKTRNGGVFRLTPNAKGMESRAA